MNEVTDRPSLLAVLAAPVLLLGAVFFLTRKDTGLGEEPAERVTLVPKQLPAQRRRHQARKFYGSAVLARQSALSMRKLFYDTGNPAARERARSMAMMSNVLLADARRMDPGFVREKLSV